MDNPAFQHEPDYGSISKNSKEKLEQPPPPKYDEISKVPSAPNAPVGPKPEETVRMKRQIGLWGGVSLIVGTMIGSGIFITPQRLLERTDSVAMSLSVWAACGVLATLAALSYCELGTVVPRSGGEHAYYMATFAPLHRFFGQLPAFLFSWMTILLLKPSSLSIVCLAFGKYALYPLLSTEKFCLEFQDTTEFINAQKVLAVFIACTIGAVNIISAQLATRVAIVFVGAKLIGMGIMIGIGIYNVAQEDWGVLTGKWDTGDASVGDIASSFYSGLWAYDGWNNLNFAMEELVNPHRNLPLAILIGIPIVTALYILINLSYLTAFKIKSEMMASPAVAIDVGDKYLGVMNWLVPVMVTLSAFGTGNGSMFTAGRISYVAGRDGHMVDVLSYVHATRLTPIIAIVLNVILAIPMIFASEINDLIDLFGFASWFIYGLAITCVIILRFTQPDIERSFRVPIIIPILATLMSIFLVFVPIVYDPKLEYLIVVGFCALGILVYYPFVFKQYRLPFMDSFTKYVQFITLAAPSPYYKDD